MSRLFPGLENFLVPQWKIAPSEYRNNKLNALLLDGNRDRFRLTFTFLKATRAPRPRHRSFFLTHHDEAPSMGCHFSFQTAVSNPQKCVSKNICQCFRKIWQSSSEGNAVVVQNNIQARCSQDDPSTDAFSRHARGMP